MKISSYHKLLGDTVTLEFDYSKIDTYDKVYISKVFMDTEIPGEPTDKGIKVESTVSQYYANSPILNKQNVEYGGTGFFYDKSPKLENNIEHIMPDYHLYDQWVAQKLSEGVKPKELAYYTDFSIGFTTRGCIRKCSFCVNKNYSKCLLHSVLDEFVDKDRKYICLLDDNVFACADWKTVFEELHKTGKRFQFKQGLDERLLTDEKCEELFNKSKWIGDYIFAFDNIRDRELIERKLQLIREHTNKAAKFYTFCGFNHNEPNTYNNEFWESDIKNLLERIKVLMNYGCLPYVMRYKDYILSPYAGMYITMARWCNQPSFFKKKSFREFCIANGLNSSAYRYMTQFETVCPEIAKEYFDIKYEQLNKYIKQIQKSA